MVEEKAEKQQKHLSINISPIPDAVKIIIHEQTADGGRVFEFVISPYDALGLATSLVDSSIVARVLKNTEVIVEDER